MTTQPDTMTNSPTVTGNHSRAALLAGLPVTERRMHLAGVPTAVLDGGDGAPMVLLHGPGEFAGHWMQIIPDLVKTHRVVVPDLPGHGASESPPGPLDADRVLAWLGELIDATCDAPPVLVGRVVGGAIAARYATRHDDRLRHLVLVDSLGLAAFQPAPRFSLALQRFAEAPTERSYDRLMQLCSYDLDALVEQMDQRWQPFVRYAVELAGTPRVPASLNALIGQFGVAPIPPADLDRITTPTTLIWGRHDMATPVAVGEAASARHGWPLHVIEDAADDPPIEQPDAFLTVLHNALRRP